MNAHTPILADTDTGAPDDWAHALMHRQLAALERLAEAGLEIVEAIRQQATGTADVDTHPPFQGDVALAYARVARAVRMTLLLQSKLIHDLRSLEAGMAITRAAERRRREEVRVHRLEQAIDRAIEAQDADEDTVDRLITESAERLEDEVLYGDILERPFHEIAADICRDLGLDPSLGHVTQMPLAGMPTGRRPPAARGAIPMRHEEHEDHQEGREPLAGFLGDLGVLGGSDLRTPKASPPSPDPAPPPRPPPDR